jgi:uncharacterized membrane protein YkoI
MNWRHWKPVAFMITVGAVLCVVALAQKSGKKAEQSSQANVGETERSVTQAQVPAAALATLKKLAAGAKITEFAEEIEHGHTFYEGSWKSGSGANIDALVTPEGDIVEIEEQLEANKVPSAVLKIARDTAGQGAELAFEKKTAIFYEVKFTKDNHHYELLLTPDGRRVEEETEKGKSADENKGDDDEEKVSLNDLPGVVKAAILEHAKGGEIKKIERENENGQTIYEAEVVTGGKELELKVAADGKLLSVKAEDKEQDDDDDGKED